MAISTRDLAPQIRRVVKDTRKLYLDSAKWLVSHRPDLLGDRLDRFPGLMDDLHRGLLIKTYGIVIRADGQWTRMEKVVCAIMIEHLWGSRLSGSALREAAEQVLSQAESLTWQALVRPFVEYEPLRDRHSQIETCVSRLANLVAKCDGLTTPAETDVLHRLQQDLIEALLLGTDDYLKPQPLPQALSQPQRVPGSKAPAASSISASTDTEDQSTLDDRLEESMRELEDLIGLSNVKEQVCSLANFLRLQKKRVAAGFPAMPISLHMAFIGNPGTGKTTVARIVGQILGAMQILSKGHVVETDRSGLVAEFAGQTATKSNKLIDSALDGVLFIDEAYSLVDESGEDAFGREAIQTLLKRMEDDRERLVVILAGYGDEMKQMIRSNPGLSSRIGTRLAFEDYAPTELGRIFELLCETNHYQLPWQSRHRIIVGLSELFARRDRHFGNGRLVRNSFEKTVRELANRVADIMPLTEELLTTLQPEDIAISGLSNEELDQLAARPHSLRVICPKCSKSPKIDETLLGRTVRCRGCDKQFVADWATAEFKT